ncbi:MAG TPA: DUF882 domain-containing protein [Desulfosarcina sp.]|nr:DUF882 domain-containing protein [Desulfosarcina sp.]
MMMDTCSRRDFIKIGTGLAGAWLLPAAGWAALLPHDSRRSLAFFNTHTGERLRVCYFRDGAYSSGALQQINHILRDHRTGDIKVMDRRLMDLLFTVRHRLGCDDPFHIISGYRSPATNRKLRQQSSGVAKFSYHTLGRAIDIRLPGCDTRKLKQACLDSELGGVGYYPRSDFVHVDTGAIRTWNG